MSAPLHRKGPVLAQLNDNWRIVHHPAQWILQVYGGVRYSGAPIWHGRSFCTTLTTLKRCVCEYCGDIEPDALAVISALPAVHPRIERLRRECRA